MELSAKNFLYTILLNKDTEKIADAYIMGYLEKHPHLVDAYCKKRKIYVVEVYILFDGKIDSTAELSLFFTKKDAINKIINWVLMADSEDWSEEYDKEHIIDWFEEHDEGDFYDMRIVLTEKYIR